jgi:hypothetical protein
MTLPIRDLGHLLAALSPRRHPGTWAWCTLAVDVAPDADAQPIATMREEEGLSVVVADEKAAERGWPVAFRAAWITLSVHSDLQAVGLIAAVSDALARAGIACNVIAGTQHDHLFVPVERAGDAMRVLALLQAGGTNAGVRSET